MVFSFKLRNCTRNTWVFLLYDFVWSSLSKWFTEGMFLFPNSTALNQKMHIIKLFRSKRQVNRNFLYAYVLRSIGFHCLKWCLLCWFEFSENQFVYIHINFQMNHWCVCIHLRFDLLWLLIVIGLVIKAVYTQNVISFNANWNRFRWIGHLKISSE